MADTCKFSTYGYACRKPVEHGRYLCEEHASAKCASCGQSATHGCDFCGQFVCGMPLCDECTFGTDETKSSGAWGFMNHIHISKPEFADKHENVRLKAALAAKDAEIARLREALEAIRLYANDTLSGRADGLDDRQWQREAVIECRNRARMALNPEKSDA